MAFRVGQKVVCVDDSQGPDDLLDKRFTYTRCPVKKGEVYVVLETGLTHMADLRRLPCIRIEEASLPVWAHRFRPAVERKTDISIFTKILHDVRSHEPASS